MEILSSLAVPGSAICAAVIGVVSLMRLRSTDREALSNSQRSYIEKLEDARDEADTRADRFRDELDVERELRITIQQQKLIADGQILALQNRLTIAEAMLQQQTPPSALPPGNSSDSDS